MPVTPTYPGVYIEEIPSGVRTITGVSTSIAAFFGQAKEGPINKAIRLLSFADYERSFGPPHPESELATAVRLFFQNGGSDCYVVRLVKAETGAKASLVIKNEAGDQDVLKFTAKEIGTWGNELSLEVDYSTGQPEETFHVRVYRMGSDGRAKAVEEFLNCSMDIDSPRFPPHLITQESRLVDCQHVFASDAAYRGAAPGPGYSESRRPFTQNQAGRNQFAGLIAAAHNTSRFKLSIDGSAFFEVNLEDAFATGANEAQILDAIKIRINQALPPALADAVEPGFETITASPPHLNVLRLKSNTPEKKDIVIQPGSSKDLASVLMLGTDQGGIERSRYAPLRPAASGVFLSFEQLNQLACLPQNHFSKITLDGNEIDLGTKLQTTGAADNWYEGFVAAGIKNSDGLREKLAIMAAAINDAGVGWSAKVAGSRLMLQKRSGPSFAIGTIATSAANDIGAFFGTNTRYYSLGTALGTFQNAVGTQSGIEGDAPDVASYTGKESDHTGFYALDLVDLFNLMIIPKDSTLSGNDYRGLWAPASTYCKDHRALLLIDPPDGWASYREVVDPAKGIRKLRTGVVKDYSALFYPHIKVRQNGLLKPVGPAGAIAGLMARIDSSRGVWKAPAGMEATLTGALDLDVLLTDLENGVLNKEGVNCLRSFPMGIVNWGARTMDGADDFASEWKYIPIRRMALYIEESLYRGTKWVVFEPNDEPLWSQIRLNVGAFMHTLFRQGAFQGSSPREGYFVKCDKETTTQDDINRGIVNILVGFAPLKPAEFVIIKIQQIAREIET
jgi:hypothetical protein